MGRLNIAGDVFPRLRRKRDTPTGADDDPPRTAVRVIKTNFRRAVHISNLPFVD